MRTGRRGRPPLRVPDGLALTQTITHRDAHGRLLEIERRATVGAPVPQPRTVRVERPNGVPRDRRAAPPRKTHAFAKAAETWDALRGLTVFEHTWLRPHPALRRPSATPGRRYDRRTPALGLTEHRRTRLEFLTTHVPITS